LVTKSQGDLGLGITALGGQPEALGDLALELLQAMVFFDAWS
jgi:hypothetical protein